MGVCAKGGIGVVWEGQGCAALALCCAKLCQAELCCAVLHYVTLCSLCYVTSGS